jgi:type I restriction enzyme S subunit
MAKAMMYLPPLAEQRKIAEILRTWDEAIETAEAELKAKQERKRWLITMVMRKSYGTKSVSQFGTLKKGGAILREKLRSEGVPVVLYGDIYTKYSEIVTRLISRVDASAVVDGVKLNSGDIVFAGSGETAEEIGKCIAYVGEEAAFAGGDVVILSNHGQDPRYLGYALNSEDAIRQKMRLGQGSSVMHLYKDDVASIKIPLPPISDQRKVGEILSEADTDIELINQRINVLRAQKRGLMQKLLTGEVRVAA